MMTSVTLFIQMRSEAATAGKGPAKESIWQFFVDKAANNLHIVLTMSPVGDTLRSRCRNFPGRMFIGYALIIRSLICIVFGHVVILVV